MKKNELSPMPNNIRRFGKTRLLLVILGLLFLLLIIFLLADVSRQGQIVKKENPKRRLGKMSQERWYSEDRFNLGNYLIESSDQEENDSPNLISTPQDEYKVNLEVEDVHVSKEYQEAVKAPGEITVVKGVDSSSTRTENITTNSSSNLSDSPQNFVLGELGKQAKQLQTGVSNKQRKERFLRAGISQGDYLSYAKGSPLSQFELKAGTLLPAILEQGINSELPGNVRARVRANVYDTVTGNHVLIPQGASLIGRYDSTIGFGQNRALVVWQRLIFPDGSSLNLEKMQGVDVAGYAGFKDKVKHHHLQIYGNALLLSLVGASYGVTCPGYGC